MLIGLFCNSKNIYYMNLSCMEIGEVEAATTFYSIARLQCLQASLTVLDLKENRIGVKGACAMANSLQYWPNLQELDLSGGSTHTNVGESGSKRLSKKLHVCTRLKRLSLCFNGLTTSTGLSVAENLLKCTQLTELNFSHNLIIQKDKFNLYPHVFIYQ